VRPIVRGWLNCNQVVLRAVGDNIVIDSGYCTHRERTLELVAGPAGLEGEPLERLINTHCHSDHMGGNAALASAYGCRVTIPAGEVKNVLPWTPQSVWMEKFDQRADPFRFDDTIAPGDTFDGGGFEWQAHAAPGHDMDALMFFEPENRILVSGDALWADGMGLVWPEEGANPALGAAREALATIERLDPARNARHVLKVLLVFVLLERGSMPVADLPAYVARVPSYGELSQRFLGLDDAALARWLLEDLLRAGAVTLRDGAIKPSMAA